MHIGDSVARVASRALIGLVIGAAAQTASAEYCPDEPMTAIVHTNQYIYFQTKAYCPNWCLINPSWSESQKDRAFSLLMTAISQHKATNIFFPGQCVVQPLYSQPEAFIYVR